MFCAIAGRMNLKCTGVAKSTQYISTLDNMFNGPAVIPLIKEISCLLPLLYIHQEFQAIFNNRNLGIKRIGKKSFFLFHSFQLPNSNIISFIDTLGRKYVFQCSYNFIFPPVNSESEGLKHKIVIELVDNQLRQFVCLTKDQPAIFSVANFFTVIPGFQDSPVKESRIDFLRLVSGEKPYRDP